MGKRETFTCSHLDPVFDGDQLSAFEQEPHSVIQGGT